MNDRCHRFPWMKGLSPQLDHWASFTCCELPDWPVFALHRNIRDIVGGGIVLLHAHAAQDQQVPFGLALQFRRYDVVGLF